MLWNGWAGMTRKATLLTIMLRTSTHNHGVPQGLTCSEKLVWIIAEDAEVVEKLTGLTVLCHQNIKKNGLKMGQNQS